MSKRCQNLECDIIFWTKNKRRKYCCTKCAGQVIKLKNEINVELYHFNSEQLLCDNNFKNIMIYGAKLAYFDANKLTFLNNIQKSIFKYGQNYYKREKKCHVDHHDYLIDNSEIICYIINLIEKYECINKLKIDVKEYITDQKIESVLV